MIDAASDEIARIALAAPRVTGSILPELHIFDIDARSLQIFHDMHNFAGPPEIDEPISGLTAEHRA